MKTFTTTLLFVMVGGISLFAQVRETEATIYLNQGGNPQGYITDSAPGAIKFATTQGGPSRVIQLSDIKGVGIEKGIRLSERSEVLANARAAFSEGNYQEAAQRFGEVADAYGFILNIPQNFASEAKFFQIESLRRLGNFAAIGQQLDTPAGKSIDKMLSDRYKKLSEFHRLWAIYGSGDVGALEKALEAYQEPVVGKAKLLPAPNFKKMPQSELIQIAFMRGKLYDVKGEKDKALQDYNRVFSLTFANEPYLAKQAMAQSMVIQSQNPALNSESEKKREAPEKAIQTVAYFFSKRFPGAKIPEEFQKYAVRPKIEVVLAAKEPEPEEAKPEAPKEEEAKKEEPSKGKAKAKGNKKGKAKGKGK